jgi:hypothetical protein
LFNFGLKSTLSGAALAFGLTFAPAANATTYVLQNGFMESARTLNIQGIGNAKSTAMQFDGFIDGTPDVPFTNLVAFCVDVYHSISLGDYNPDLTYTDDIDLTHDSNWDPNARQILTSGQVLQIGRLVNYGTNVFNYASPGVARFDELAAVQGAIWKVVSSRNVTAASGNNAQKLAMNNRINALAGISYNSAFNLSYGAVNNGITFITPFKEKQTRNGIQLITYPNRNLTQSFAFAGGFGGAAIPEPATWALMIGGFTLAGGVLRAQRRKGATVVVRG